MTNKMQNFKFERKTAKFALGYQDLGNSKALKAVSHDTQRNKKQEIGAFFLLLLLYPFIQKSPSLSHLTKI